MATVLSVVSMPDGEGGNFVLYWRQDQTADLWHRLAGQPMRLAHEPASPAGSAAMAELGSPTTAGSAA